MSCAMRLRAIAACAMLAGCVDVEPPEGRLVCATSAECPADWVCRTDDRCYRTDDLDASTVDAGVDGSRMDARVDGSRLDEGVPLLDEGMPPLDEGMPPLDEGMPPLDEGIAPDMNVGVDAGLCTFGEVRPCASGSDVGECAVGTETCSALGAWGTCMGSQGPVAELCNNADDDCDGIVDNAVPPGPMCTMGIGACTRTGALLSCVGGVYMMCNALPGTPTAETCNAVDDDCDGVIDDGVPAGMACTAGLGACRRTGTLLCTGGSYAGCSVTAGAATAELCNGVDDDCDGMIDDGVPPGIACTAGVGACRRTGTLVCMGGSYAGCSVTAGAATAETCNGVDDDCDGVIDDIVPACSPIVGLVAGSNNSCALRSSGAVLCWGANGYGQLGDGTTTTRLTPTPVSGLTDAVELGVEGANHTCARRSSGAVVCWGLNASGRVGDGTVMDRLTPTAVSGLTDAIEISAGGHQTFARRSSGAVISWGNNSYGELGDGTVTDRLTPVPVSGGIADAVELAGGGLHACLRRSTGTVMCWGYNAIGAVGDGTTVNRYTPTLVTGLTDAVQLSVGAYLATCARRSSGAVVCWGDNGAGQVGDGTTTNRLVPTAVSGLADAVEVSIGGYHACARRISGVVVCWGRNVDGRLGDGTTTDRLTPTPVSGLTDAVEISVGYDHTCARRATGAAVCWGHNAAGQLGDGTTIDRLVPTPVVGL